MDFIRTSEIDVHVAKAHGWEFCEEKIDRDGDVYCGACWRRWGGTPHFQIHEGVMPPAYSTDWRLFGPLLSQLLLTSPWDLRANAARDGWQMVNTHKNIVISEDFIGYAVCKAWLEEHPGS